ncbi:hypothetical protein EMCRGX_G030941 [Ephydatia muelleri]|eukprot:Em0018g1025a
MTCRPTVNIPAKTCIVRRLDSLDQEVVLSKKAIGSECLDKVCKSLGIHEKDYFGLRYTDKNGDSLWLNLRNPIYEQLHGNRPVAEMKVKYFIKPQKIIQSITRQHFYKHLKKDLLLGKLKPSSNKAARLTALIAQVDKGDYRSDVQYHQKVHGSGDNDNMDARIRREHQKLHGLSQELATEKFLEEVSQLELYGVELHHVTDSDQVEKIIGVGPEDIHIYSSNMDLLNRYSYTAVQYTAFHGKKFTAMLTSTEHGGNDRLELDLKTRSAAQALYRGITEFHTFFRRDSVSRVVKTAGYCKSILGNLKGQNPDRFYFDIVRTHKEVVDNVWTILHPATPTTNAPPVNSPPLSHPAARSQSTQSHVHHRPAVSRHRQALPPLPPYSQRSRSVDVVAGPNRLCVAPLGGRTDTPESEENSYVPGGSDTYVMIRRGSDRPGCGVGSDSVSSTSEDQYINSASDTYVNYSSDTYITSEGSECSGASMASMDHRTTSPPPIYTEIDLEHSTSQETGGAPNSAMISLSSPTHQPSSQDAAAALSRAQQLESELQRLRNAMTCRSCKDKPIGAIFCPCGHTVCCYECAQHLRECIQCHRQVDSIQRVLLA